MGIRCVLSVIRDTPPSWGHLTEHINDVLGVWAGQCLSRTHETPDWDFPSLTSLTSSPHKVRRPSRSCLRTALWELTGPETWTLEAHCFHPLSVRVVGDTDFIRWQHSGPDHDRRKTARGAIARAIAGAAEHANPRFLELIIGNRHKRSDFDPTSLARHLKPFRTRILREVSDTIEAGGHDAIIALANGQRHPTSVPDPAPNTAVFSLADLDALLDRPVAPPRKDPLRRGWENGRIPSDAALKKAIKYVFGQGWDIEPYSTDPISLSIRNPLRFAPHIEGLHLANEAEVARTIAFRAVDLIVWGAGPTLLSRLVPEIEGQALSPDDVRVWLDEAQARLKTMLLDAVENEGYKGLLRVLRELGE